jgi:hypothetical protein
MKCSTNPNHEVVENWAGGKSFWYCRSCKEEVRELPGKEYRQSLEDIKGVMFPEKGLVLSGLDNWLPSGCTMPGTTVTAGSKNLWTEVLKSIKSMQDAGYKMMDEESVRLCGLKEFLDNEDRKKK